LTAPDPSNSKPVTSTPVSMRAPAARALSARAEHRLAVERVAAGALVQADGQAGRAPVGVQVAHVRLDVLLSDDQLGGVPDPLLALVHRDQVLLLGRAVRARCSRCR